MQLPDLNRTTLALAEGIGSFLSTQLLTNQGFPTRSFYAESYSLALLARTGQITPETRSILLERFHKLDQKEASFHWEFNRYALGEYQDHSQDSACSSFLNLNQFCYTKVTNWTLLRCLVLLKSGKQESEAVRLAKRTLKKHQLANGLIQDDSSSRSYQYHCFSLALTADLWALTKDSYFKEAFMKGVNFISHFILANGDTLYIGRGQQQIFGYASLVYALSVALALTQEAGWMNQLGAVLQFILKRQRADGSFPLVLRGGEENQDRNVDTEDPAFLGWYCYNNLFDYLAFAGYYFYKSHEALSKITLPEAALSSSPSSGYEDALFIKKSTSRYEAVIAKPGGYLTNDLPMPYIAYQNQSITPCYGGEQFAESLYSANDLPLPYSPRFHHTLRYKSAALLRNSQLRLISPLGAMKRTFSFQEEKILIATTTVSPLRLIHQYLFFEDIEQETPCVLAGKGFRVTSPSPFTFLRHGYCAQGRLKVFGVEGKNSKISIGFHE